MLILAWALGIRILRPTGKGEANAEVSTDSTADNVEEADRES